MIIEAEFSPCRLYRYTWSTRWDAWKPAAMFIGLNPSTADERKADPTVRRCMRYAIDWGYGGLVMTNLFAWRDTDPRAMKAAANPVGEENDLHLIAQAHDAGIVIAAWGTHGAHLGRGELVRNLIPNLYYLRLTREGHPSHPLYLPANLTPQRWANR